MDTSDSKLSAEIRCEIELSDDGVLGIRPIHVHYKIEAPESAGEKVEKAHHRHCPVYRSLEAAIDITTDLKTTDLELVD